MGTGPLPKYREMVKAGEIEKDYAQLMAVEKLQLVANRLAVYQPPARTDFFSFFTRKSGEIPKGLYIFGGVGRGKTMLMDMFFETVPYALKRRVHFLEFMAEVHDAIAAARKNSQGEPIAQIAKEISLSTHLLCFDEFHVTDITDAMILGRFFKALFDENIILIATSNCAPKELYKDGLNRQLFLPFIDILEDRMEILELEAEKDYRLERLTGLELYFICAPGKACPALEKAWLRLTGRRQGEPYELTVKGRTLKIRESHLGVAKFTFSELCEGPRGAADFLALAHRFHTVFIQNIPIMGKEKRNEARRFIHLVDSFYDNGVRLIVSAEAEPQKLYPEGDGVTLFERTVSRLMEMRSASYLAGHHSLHGAHMSEDRTQNLT